MKGSKTNFHGNIMGIKDKNVKFIVLNSIFYNSSSNINNFVNLILTRKNYFFPL